MGHIGLYLAISGYRLGSARVGSGRVDLSGQFLGQFLGQKIVKNRVKIRVKNRVIFWAKNRVENRQKIVKNFVRFF